MTAVAGHPLRARRLITRRSWSRAAWQIFAFAGALLLWVIATSVLGARAFPGPAAVTMALVGEIASTEFWMAVGQTLLSTALGLAVAAAIAIPSGLLIGASRFTTRSTRVLLDFLASIPPVCFLPLALLLFGPSLPMKLLLIGYGCCWPLLLRSIDALRDIDAVQHDVCTAFGLSTRSRWLRVFIPAALPGVIVGLRTAATIALLLSIVAEYIGGADGLGSVLLRAQQNGQSDVVLAVAIITALLGVALNKGMHGLERLSISWHPSMRGASS